MRALGAVWGAIFLVACANAPESAEVGQTGGMCGGIAGFQCASSNDFCATAPGGCVQVADLAGVCKPRPNVCTMEYKPVCGCDGATYPSACSAAAKGVSVAAEGECGASRD